MQETEANRFSKHPLMPSDRVGTNGFGVSNIVGMEPWEELTEKRDGTGKIVRHHHAKKRSAKNLLCMTRMRTQAFWWEKAKWREIFFKFW